MSEVTMPAEESAATAGPIRIVIGYSAKPEGRAALRRGLDEARLRSAEVVVVHTAVDAELSDLLAELAQSGVEHRVEATREGFDPAEELLHTAESCSADFIIIGLRRRSPVGKLLLGSSAQRVLLDASCPVLAVKADAEDHR